MKDLNCSGIYQIRNLVNGKVYVGSAMDINQRKKIHFRYLKGQYHINKHLQNSFNRYGKDNFILEVLELMKDINKLTEREQYWIDKTKCANRKFGYNVCSMANSMLGYKHTKETKLKLSEIRKGKAYTKGVKYSKEIKEKMSKTMYKYYNSTKGEKIKNNISNSLKKYYNTQKGNSVRKLKSKQLKDTPLRKTIPVIQLDLNNNPIKIWESIKKAGKILNINISCISGCLRKKQKTAGNFKWEYF